MNRRGFLRGVGGAMVALPVLTSLSEKASAQVADNKKLIVFFQPNGVNPPDFWPSLTRAGELTQQSFAGRGVEPLASFRNKLLIPRGIHLSVRGYVNDGSNPGCDHRKGTSCKLTAAPLDTGGQNLATGHSIDFEAARTLNRAGGDPLVIQVGPKGNPNTDGATDFISYRAARQPYAGENNPWNIYRTMMNIQPGTPTDDLLTRRRASILDVVRGELTEIRRLPMSAADRARLITWQDLVRDTETQLPTMSCSPDTPTTLGISNVERYNGMSAEQIRSDSEYRAVGGLMMRLTALAAVCDTNRVITMQWSRGSGGPQFTWDGLNHPYNHHQLSHHSSRDSDTAPGAMAVPEAPGFVHQIDQWYGARFGELLGMLDMFADGTSGQTLLDRSAVMWINELSDGKAHSFTNMPVVIAGSGGGYLRQGQLVDCQPTPTTNGSFDFFNWNGGPAAPHNRLLTTLLNAVGATNNGAAYTRFGDTNWGEPGEFDVMKA